MTSPTRAIAPISALLLAVSATATGLSAQVLNEILPLTYASGGSRMTQIPLATAPIRYQQLFTAKELAKYKTLQKPVRFKGIRFRTKAKNYPGATVTLQLTVGYYTGFGSPVFDQNLAQGKKVFSGQITLPQSTGGWDVNLPFNQNFTWDSVSNVCFDLRVFKNGKGSKPFLYFFDSYAFDPQRVGGGAMWAPGPNAVKATTTQQGTGMVMRLDFSEGAVIGYGTGCKGQGNFVPQISTTGIPVVGNTLLRIDLTKARPSTAALLAWGLSDKKWGPFTLPLDLRLAGLPGCTLLADPFFFNATTTSGGGPGAGRGSVGFPIPGLAFLKGIDFYCQWWVVDDSQNRPIDLAFSSALRLAIG
ncbi:MAG: hypothetical protein QGG14_01055 [Planctomycetota bacterium]|jgi:hypothetical protein|nr:hypothetical protein [Planctomycetota bacterium]